ncbi:ethylbenzene dehydrogenase-related protein [Chloroflexota bacterium]
MRNLLFLVPMLLVSVILLAGCAQSQPTSAPKPTLQPNAVLSAKTDSAPVLDGQPEALWDKASSITIPIAGGANSGSHEATLKSVYSGDSVYFLVQWTDPTESLYRMPWQKQADGSWKHLTTSATHQENTNYEDKLAFIWNIDNSISGFNEQGCMVTCHVGETPANSGFGSKYTANPGEIGDIWHWKAVRTNPVGQSDDQYVDSMRYDKEKASGAGRHADPKDGGGYKNNLTEDKTLPAFGIKDNKPAPTYWILDSEKESFSDASYKAGDEVPGIVVSPITGDRGDISAKGVYKDGKWTVELGRKLSTGSQYDVQYADLTKSYFFGVAVFDNAQVDHSWSNGAYELRFAK